MAVFGALLAVGAVVLLVPGRDAAPSPDPAAFDEKLGFNKHIQPILSANCYHCHGPDSHGREADLRLDREEYAFAPRKDGPVIIPGDPDRSPLVRRIESENESEIMPPPESHRSLTQEEIALLRRWVQEGAQYEEHWSYIKPERPEVPRTQGDWGNNELDRFVLARLEHEQVAPSPEADKFALIRRVTFDLTGLPPTPEEIGAFLDDTSPQAYERLVDRLLASPRYGEHRARYWLDVARYGDTHGQQFDNIRLSWPYRDYVIKAFNENKPFDQFTIEQIAGDLLPAETFDQLVATGFNRAHVTTNEDGSIPEELRFNIVTDQVQTVGSVFLGMTASCAACHDHKFDPISQKDFFRLTAFFNNTSDQNFDANQASPFPTITLPPPGKEAEAEALLRERAAVERRLDERTRRSAELLQEWIASGRAGALKPVSSEGLVARFRFDEGAGVRIRNSAPGADPAYYETDGAPIQWGELVHFWPAARFGGTTRLRAGSIGDFEATDAFSVAGWFKPREARLGHNGSIVSKMAVGDEVPGWEFFWEDSRTQVMQHVREGRVLVNLVHDGEQAISVRATPILQRTRWNHLAFTYDGSGTAAGVRIYIDGEPQEVEVLKDNLSGSIRTEAPFEFARPSATVASHTLTRTLAETSFQDVRVYGRRLQDEEVRRAMHEEIAYELLQQPVAGWDEDEHKTVADFFFRNIDAPVIALRAEKERIEEQLKSVTEGGVKALISQERESLPMAHVFERGLYTERRERVGPGVPESLPPMPQGERRDRLGLARWLVSPENPLTARVTVNRMWQELFGTGIVDTPGDFGVVGAPPSHPDLLDWLAVDFQESGWDVKRFYRQVVTSATYRQSARILPEMLERDPDNRLLARGPRFRMDAEMIRDGALAASGLLAERIGGPSVNTYQPPGIWEPVSRRESNTFIHKADSGEDLYRRSLYTFWKRTANPPVLATFDAPMRDVCTMKRERTNTPLQALVMLNATAFVEAARHLAVRALQLPDSGADARFDHISMLLLNRPASPLQREVLGESLERFRTEFPDPEMARKFLSIGESPVDDSFPPEELAAWTLVASLLMNTDEALNK